MTARIVHVSDLHVGANDGGRDAVEAAVRALVARLRPELVIASGDLTHRNRPEQHERAAAFLGSLGAPALAVPGNHDIPALPPARFTRTFRAFERVWGDVEPGYCSATLVVCGVNSVRPWLYQEGAVRPRQLEQVARSFEAAPPEALRVAVLHHHLVSAPWRTAKRPVFGRGRVLEELARAGAELILSGHVHQSVVVGRREFEVGAGERHGTVVVTAPGLGRPRPRRHGEASGLHVVATDARELRVDTFAWDGTGFVVAAERRFPRII